MGRRRLEPKEHTKSYLFLPPMLDMDPVLMQKHLLLNAYLKCEDYPDYEDVMFLHYEYADIDGSFARLEINFRRQLPYIFHYEPDRYTTIFCFKIPDAYLHDDFICFKEGRYSQMSKQFKTHVLNFHSWNRQSNLGKVLYKSEDKRREIEEELNVKLPQNAELASIININKETYSSAHKINDILNLNPFYWETR